MRRLPRRRHRPARSAAGCGCTAASWAPLNGTSRSSPRASEGLQRPVDSVIGKVDGLGDVAGDERHALALDILPEGADDAHDRLGLGFQFGRPDAIWPSSTTARRRGGLALVIPPDSPDRRRWISPALAVDQGAIVVSESIGQRLGRRSGRLSDPRRSVPPALAAPALPAPRSRCRRSPAVRPRRARS